MPQAAMLYCKRFLVVIDTEIRMDASKIATVLNDNIYQDIRVVYSKEIPPLILVQDIEPQLITIIDIMWGQLRRLID